MRAHLPASDRFVDGTGALANGATRHDPLLAVRPTSSAAVVQRSPARDTTQVG